MRDFGDFTARTMVWLAPVLVLTRLLPIAVRRYSFCRVAEVQHWHSDCLCRCDAITVRAESSAGTGKQSAPFLAPDMQAGPRPSMHPPQTSLHR